MAGEALTNKFMLGTATVMLGAQANFMDLGVAESIGLVKEVTLRGVPSYVELTQGVQNDVVMSVKNGNQVTIDGQIFEYTIRNLMYGAALDGVAIAQPVNTTTTTSSVAASTAATVIPVTSPTGIVVGGMLALSVGQVDEIYVRKVTAVAGSDVTVDRGLPVTLPNGSPVRVMAAVHVGSNKQQPFHSCKIVGKIADGSWITAMFPKVRVTSGFNLAFKTDNFDNMPLGITPFVPTAADPGYAFCKDEDGNLGRGWLYAGAQ